VSTCRVSDHPIKIHFGILSTVSYNSYGDFQAFCRQKKNKTYIAKPDSGCQGKGIFVTRNPKVMRCI